MSTPSDTPRTDIHVQGNWAENFVTTQFAQGLERELNAAHQRTADELNAQQRLHVMETARLTQERDAALSEIRELKRTNGEIMDALRIQNARVHELGGSDELQEPTLLARVRELERELAKLNDPVAVHINMLRGTIATPSPELMAHVWGDGQPPAPQYLDRPNKPGWWWRLRQGGRNGAEWHIGQAKMIVWGDDDDDDGERVLCWSSGGAWSRCDAINKAGGHGDGDYYAPATPPPPPPRKEGQP